VLSVKDKNGNEITDPNHIANINPIRYRGYYYDTETGFYYLQSRYYDPTVGRFINADGLVSTGQGVLGHNMFAYCNNNPINMCDPEGTLAISAILAAVAAYKGFIALGTLLLGVVAVSAKTSTSTGIAAPSFSLPSITKSKTQAKTKAKDVVRVLPKDTVVYRYGATNPGNLTPKIKDAFSGLSFSTVPPLPGQKAAVTTIGALNATGMVVAVRDGLTHVSVKPAPHMGTLQDWINTGSSHPCTAAVKSVVIPWEVTINGSKYR